MPNFVLTICLRYIYQGFYFRYINLLISPLAVLTGLYVFHCLKKSECLATRADFTVTKSLLNMPIICHENDNFLHQDYTDYLECIVSK